ncbi:MAG: DUF502 domain-containing protein [Elusimicrobia bacterium]|nr:DUF502 domain-containing protein [Elusimicrobiota bacterium]
MNSKLKQYFITGLLTLVPIVLTFLVVAWTLIFLDSSLSPAFDVAFGRHIPGVGIAASLVVILAAGAFASNLLGQYLLEAVDKFLLLVPGFKWVYSTIKQVVTVFAPENHASFKQVVLVEYPRAGVKSLGFVTGEINFDWSGGKRGEWVSVYIPTNHFVFGDYAFFRRQDLLFTGMSVPEGIQCVLSAGAAFPPEKKRSPSAGWPKDL